MRGFGSDSFKINLANSTGKLKIFRFEELSHKLYEKTNLSFTPTYGLFPTNEKIEELIRKHQRLPGSRIQAILDRFREKRILKNKKIDSFHIYLDKSSIFASFFSGRLLKKLDYFNCLKQLENTFKESRDKSINIQTYYV
ncbi:hypothetical protein BpHYR1_045559 [Brachionus plicatilis]|uniref:Uncharacterized protein n=1 Tax=Brachionus plicatilis TaxID=10195 RepID=A0A3M7QLT5_BRAPC|nr:hypothetical protein BpHYR1_045559 [Brachionus plicatilis]